MKVIFLEDVPNVAMAGETKEVADGYGRNFLIPRKLAVLANPLASNIVEVQLKKIARRHAETEAEMIKLADQLEGKEVILKARTGAKDRLYGSITSTDIVDEISNSIGLLVDKRKIELEEPIRELGDYEITIRLTKDIMPKIKLTVVEEEEKKVKAEKKEDKEKKKVKAEKKEDKAEEGKEEKKVKVEEKEDREKKKVKAEKKEDKKKKKVKAEKKEDKAEELKKEEKKEETE